MSQQICIPLVEERVEALDLDRGASNTSNLGRSNLDLDSMSRRDQANSST
jgi:hypothetical protein